VGEDGDPRHGSAHGLGSAVEIPGVEVVEDHYTRRSQAGSDVHGVPAEARCAVGKDPAGVLLTGEGKKIDDRLEENWDVPGCGHLAEGRTLIGVGIVGVYGVAQSGKG
jgi:hypothetical protein